jgi:membrane-bound lytic murein transglycosylase B
MTQMTTTNMTRRMAVMGLAALAGCGAVATPRKSDRWASVDNPGFDAWLAGFQPKGVARDALAQARYIPAVIEKDRNQTESRLSLSEYLGIATSYERVGIGRQKLVSHAGVLRQIQDHYRVDAPVITAIWGLESLYGTRKGDVPVISALATLAYDGRRRVFFEQQLTAALKILAAGDVAPSQMLGSWAGAMGHTQFIPTS